MILDEDDAEIWALTFNGSVAGPMIVVHENDYVEVTLVNPSTSAMEHNIDFHAATGALALEVEQLHGPDHGFDRPAVEHTVVDRLRLRLDTTKGDKCQRRTENRRYSEFRDPRISHLHSPPPKAPRLRHNTPINNLARGLALSNTEDHANDRNNSRSVFQVPTHVEFSEWVD